MNANEFTRNMSSHSLEELTPFQEQFVAWSEDGKQILAHAPTLEDLYREIDTRGLAQYVVGFVPGDMVDLGGAGLL